MSQNWEKINLKLLTIKQEIQSQSKRAIKKNVPRSDSVREDIRDNLVKLFNEFTRTLAWDSLDELQKFTVHNYFEKIRDKVVRLFQLIDVYYKVPLSCIVAIDPLVFDEGFVGEEQNLENKMPMSITDFFTLASKLISGEFDGSPDKLQSFLDQISLLNLNSADYEDSAVAYVKTRLSGKARDLITNEATLDDIITTLKNGIKGESSRLLSAKLLNLKQNFKEAIDYASEIESLTLRLKRAFINEGVPNQVAESYSTETAVKSLSQNANCEKTRLIMEAGTFSNVQEAITKFVSSNSAPRNPNNVLYFNNSRRGSNNYYNNRGRGQFNRTYDNQSQRNRGRGRGNSNNNTFRRQGNNNTFARHGNYRSNNSQNGYRHVRSYGLNEFPENQPVPQRDLMLGEIHREMQGEM